jgi:hypothetical protein
MAQDTLISMDKLDSFLIQMVRYCPWELFPWAKEFSLADQRAFLLDVLQAVHSRDARRLQECLEDWQATAEALHNPDFMKAWQQPYDPGDTSRGSKYVANSTYHVILKRDAAKALTTIPNHIAQQAQGFIDTHLRHHPTQRIPSKLK